MNPGLIVASLGVAVGFLALVASTYYGLRAVHELQELPKLTEAVKGSIEGIKVGAEKTADLIRLSGEETRRAIVEAHKSIKEELGN